MDDFKRFLKVSRTDPLFLAGWILGGFTVGVLIVVAINAFLNEDRDFAPIGTLLAVVMAVVGGLVRGNGTGQTRLALAVSMGQTRRGYLLFDSVMNVVWFALALAVCRGLAWAEQGLYALLYPGYENGLPLDKLFLPPVMALLCAAVVALNLFFTMLLTRLGPKSAFLWMVPWLGLLLIARAVDAAEEGGASPLALLGRGMMALIRALTWQGWIAVGFGAALALAAAGVLGLQRIEVRL